MQMSRHNAHASIVSDRTGLRAQADPPRKKVALVAVWQEAVDTVAVAALEATLTWVTPFALDTLAVQIADAGSKSDAETAIPKAVSDTLEILSEDAALTEIAGPYWNGWTGQEPALVHADSYAMGPREQPWDRC